MLNLDTRQGISVSDDSEGHNRRRPARGTAPDPHRRPVTWWDATSFLGLTCLVLTAMSLMPLIADGWYYRPRLVIAAAMITGLATAVAGFGATRRDRPASLSGLTDRLTAAWLRPPSHWTAFVLGAIISLPLLGLYTRLLSPDADSMRLISAIRHVQRGNLDFLIETQDSFGPHLLMGLPLLLAGAAGVTVVTVLSMQLLLGLVAWLAYRVSSSMAAAGLSALAMLCISPFMERALVLPMYPAMLAFGVLGIWVAHRVVVRGSGWWWALGAAALLAMANETQPVGQLFLAAPLLLIVLNPNLRQGLRGALRVMLMTGVVLLPRLAVNLAEGGFSHLRSNRTDYWITEGYLRQIQDDYWGYAGLNDPVLTYLLTFPQRLASSLGSAGWLVLALAALALVGLRGRARWFALACLGLVVAAMTVRGIQPVPRYFSPLWPGIGLLAGVSCAWLLRQRPHLPRVLGAVVAVALTVGAAYNLREVAIDGRELADTTNLVRYTEAAELIDDGRGVIGPRSHALVSVDTDLPTFGGHLLTEEEYVTFLTWPSDEEVINVLEGRNLGWVVSTRPHQIEYEYNDTWLVPNYGLETRYLKMVEYSPHFCRAYVSGPFVLYRLGEC